MVNIPSPLIASASVSASSRREWAIIGMAIGVGVLIFGISFRTEIETAIYVWINSDAYNHCFLVLPVAAYLAWERRRAAANTTLSPAPWLFFLAIPIAVAWFVADRLGAMEGRQLMAMALFQIMLASLFGLRTWRSLSAPLLYLFFLVPFGEFVVSPLQGLVVLFTTAGLHIVQIPFFSNGVSIEIPEGTFIVHQACSGLRFLIASLAFGVLYACLMYTSPLRRAIFILFSIGLAIIGNCFRVFGTILLAHYIGNAEAVEADHVLWGWLFYVLIGSVLILVGLLFRQEPRSGVTVHPPVRGRVMRAAVIALAAMVLLATIPPLAARYLDGVGISEQGVPASLAAAPPIPNCASVALPDAAVALAPEARSIAYKCDDGAYLLTLHRYPPRIGVRPLFSSIRDAAVPTGWDIITQRDFRVGGGTSRLVWRVTEGSVEGHYAAVATALWLNDLPSDTGITARVEQALNTIRGSAKSPVLAVVTHSGAESPEEARTAINQFLVNTVPLSALVSHWLTMQ